MAWEWGYISLGIQKIQVQTGRQVWELEIISLPELATFLNF